MSHPDHETQSNTSANPHFEDILARGLASPGRRMILRGGVGMAGLALLPGCASLATGSAPVQALGFPSLEKSLLDDVVLPPGYRYTVLHATGDSLDPQLPAYSNTGAETDDWSKRIGDHHDALDIFFIDASGRYTETDTGRAVLVVNHESSADAHFMHPAGQTSNGVSGKKFTQFGDWDLGARPELEVLKEINHHGVSVVEIERGPQGWRGRGV